MKTKAAVILEKGVPFQVLQVDLENPAQGDVLVRVQARGGS